MVLKKFREEDEEQFAQIMFKAGTIISKQDCLLQGQAQLDQRVIFRFSTLRLRSKKEKNILNFFHILGVGWSEGVNEF